MAESCTNCDRCTWSPGLPPCHASDHRKCTICGHCEFRHWPPLEQEMTWLPGSTPATSDPESAPTPRPGT